MLCCRSICLQIIPFSLIADGFHQTSNLNFDLRYIKIKFIDANQIHKPCFSMAASLPVPVGKC